MSILRWLKKEKTCGLPDPDEEKSAEMRAVVASANAEVGDKQNAVLKKRGDYASYDECVRAKIGRFACEHGTAAAVKKFNGELGRPVAEKALCSCHQGGWW